MQKTILITGATDGIGLETARMLVSQGHNILLHGRSREKLENVTKKLSASSREGQIESYLSDLSNMVDVEELTKAVADSHSELDVLINNAGVYKVPDPITRDGLDARFAVNAIAPYLLTKRLLPLFDTSGRVISLSSAAQSTVDPEALAGRVRLFDDLEIYAQSKLALTMWSRTMALSLGNDGPTFIAVNPGSMLGTKMVKQGFGVAGKNIGIGAKILTRLAMDDEFETASGQYFDNDYGQFTSPHPDALDPKKCAEIMYAIEAVLAEIKP